MFVYLQKIFIVNNVIHNMSIDALYGLNNLKSLRLERCLLRHMPPISHVKDTLLSLFVPGNLITYISDGYFEDFRDLTVLSIAKNYMTQFPDVSPIYQTLHTLSLHSNRIHTIPNVMVDNTFIALNSSWPGGLAKMGHF